MSCSGARVSRNSHALSVSVHGIEIEVGGGVEGRVRDLVTVRMSEGVGAGDQGSGDGGAEGGSGAEAECEEGELHG